MGSSRFEETVRQLGEDLATARVRLDRQGLLAAPAAPQAGSLSARVPGADAMLYLQQAGSAEVYDLKDDARAHWPDQTLAHAQLYAGRPDAGAVCLGGGFFGRALARFGGALPAVFDEQVRHLGRMPPPVPAGAPAARVRAALRAGGNVALFGGNVACIGTNVRRLVLNVELFEKCAQAHVLAVATGGRVSRLPWWVCRIANGRLLRDERRAAQSFAAGAIPADVRGY